MLWVQSLSSLNTSIKVGTTRNPSSGKAEPTVESLVEMFTFCDKILRQEEEEDGMKNRVRQKYHLLCFVIYRNTNWSGQ